MELWRCLDNISHASCRSFSDMNPMCFREEPLNVAVVASNPPVLKLALHLLRPVSWGSCMCMVAIFFCSDEGGQVRQRDSCINDQFNAACWMITFGPPYRIKLWSASNVSVPLLSLHLPSAAAALRVDWRRIRRGGNASHRYGL